MKRIYLYLTCSVLLTLLIISKNTFSQSQMEGLHGYEALDGGHHQAYNINA